jgi:hypothetical protein
MGAEQKGKIIDGLGQVLAGRGDCDGDDGERSPVTEGDGGFCAGRRPAAGGLRLWVQSKSDPNAGRQAPAPKAASMPLQILTSGTGV